MNTYCKVSVTLAIGSEQLITDLDLIVHSPVSVLLLMVIWCDLISDTIIL